MIESPVRGLACFSLLGFSLAVMLLAPSLVAAQGPTAEPAARDPEAWEQLDRRPGEGEQCLVCGQQIYGKDIAELRYKGRTFHVSADMLDEFADQPDSYFHKLQARSALFDENALARISRGWLLFGLYVVLGLASAALCGYLAVERALAPLPWFFAGLLFNLLALGALLAAPRGDLAALPAGVPAGLAKVPRTRAPVACPVCGASNHPAATACASCGAPLEARVEAETARV